MSDIFGDSISPTPVAVDPESEYDDAKERFNELIKNRRNNAATELEQNIIDNTNNYEHATRQARNYLWQANDMKSTLESLKQSQESQIESLNAEFDALLRHDKVDAVGIRNQEVLVKTVELDITNPDTSESWPLGAFEIELPLTPDRSNRISVINRTGARTDGGSTYHHPHVLNDAPCFGAIEEQIVQSLSSGEINGTFELLLEYLQTFNPEDSYGQHIRYWSGERLEEY
jgi:hypothetical protein